MRKILTATSALLVALGLSLAADAAEIQGKIKAVDPAGQSVTLEDGTTLKLPGDLKVARASLKPGAMVKASYDDQGGSKVVTGIQVMPGK